MIRFGKSLGDLMPFRENFFQDNESLLDRARRQAELYISQPLRSLCKLCGTSIATSHDFMSFKVPYKFCLGCGHLNGGHEDTPAFLEALYTQGGGAEYASAYMAPDETAFYSRVDKIYHPKAEFLHDGLKEQGHDPTKLSYADFGAGNGAFISALRQLGVKNCHGFEVSSLLTEQADTLLGKGSVQSLALDAIQDKLSNVEADVISMIFVLEHLQFPTQVFTALKKNPKARYLFVAIPLFSPSVLLEAIFQNVMPRILGGGHTHLFTHQSLAWLEGQFGLERAAEWWFGTDMMDLFRSTIVSLSQDPDRQALADRGREMLSAAIDDMQLVLDKRMLSSEVHLIYRLEN